MPQVFAQSLFLLHTEPQLLLLVVIYDLSTYTRYIAVFIFFYCTVFLMFSILLFCGIKITLLPGVSISTRKAEVVGTVKISLK